MHVLCSRPQLGSLVLLFLPHLATTIPFSEPSKPDRQRHSIYAIVYTIGESIPTLSLPTFLVESHLEMALPYSPISTCDEFPPG